MIEFGLKVPLLEGVKFNTNKFLISFVQFFLCNLIRKPNLLKFLMYDFFHLHSPRMIFA